MSGTYLRGKEQVFFNMLLAKTIVNIGAQEEQLELEMTVTYLPYVKGVPQQATTH